MEIDPAAESADNAVIDGHIPGKNDIAPGASVDGFPDANSVEVNDALQMNSPSQPSNLNAVPDQVSSNDGGTVVNGDLYASRAARTARKLRCLPLRSTSARSVFEVFRCSNSNLTDIQCLQREMDSEVVVTFKTLAVIKRFLRLNSITIDSENNAVQDINRPLTFVTIYDALFELSDFTIIKRLAPFCEVIHYRRRKFDFQPNIYNGLRHYRVRIIKLIPSFLHFGKYQIF